MPEMPEVETVRRSLEPHTIGRTIVGLRPGHFTGVMGGHDIGEVAARLRGRRIVRLRRRAKYLIVDLDDGSSLLVHLRMTGHLTVARRSAPPERFEHLAIELDDGHDLRFADQRKFGRVLHVLPDEIRSLSDRIGPEPLSPSFTAGRLAADLKRRSGKLKSVLLDQRLLAGLGNIYADEALFRARLHPLRRPDSLTPMETRSLHRAIRAVLREGLENRGTSFSSYRDGLGEAGANQGNLRVYGRGRLGLPCPRCGKPLACLVIGGRSSHFCPNCQLLSAD